MDYVTRITKGRILNVARHSGKIHSRTRANFFSSVYIYIYIREFSKPFEILVTSSNVRISWLIIRKQDTSYTNYIQVWM